MVNLKNLTPPHLCWYFPSFSEFFEKLVLKLVLCILILVLAHLSTYGKKVKAKGGWKYLAEYEG